MFSYIWHTVFFDPVYNILVWCIDTLPSSDVGLAVIVTVVLVKLLVLPVALKASRTTQLMKKIQPELQAIQEKYKGKSQELSAHMWEVYRREKLSPFSPFLVLIIQLPVLFALYFSVRSLPAIKTEILYGFVKVPETVNMLFLGQIHMDTRNLALAILAAVTMYIQSRITLPKVESTKREEPSFARDMQESMRTSMLYVMPVMVGIAGYTLSAVFALYFTISNITSIAQELYTRKKLAKEAYEKTA